MYRLKLDKEAARAHLCCYYDAIHSALNALADGDVIKFWHSSYKFSLATANGCVRGLFRLLLKYDSSREDSFLTAPPERLNELVRDYEHYVAVHNWNKGKTPYRECFKLLGALYSYDRFSRAKKALVFDSKKNALRNACIVNIQDARYKGEAWSPICFIKSLNVKYCPYCNAESVYAIKFDGDDIVKSARSALDHYYPISKYPFLGISLCNLVPSCTRCNTDIKGDRELDDRQHLNPYSGSLHDAVKFLCRPIDMAVAFSPEKVNSEDGFVFDVVPRADCPVNLADRGKALSDFFKVKDVYNELFKYEAINYIYKSRLVGSSYCDYVRQMLKANLTDAQIKMMFCDLVDDPSKINRVRLSKLALDMHQMVDEQWQR